MPPQRHSLPQTRHNECVSNTQQRQVLAEVDILRVQEDHGLVREGGVARVDMGDGGKDRRGDGVGVRRSVEVGVFGRWGRERDLDQDDLETDKMQISKISVRRQREAEAHTFSWNVGYLSRNTSNAWIFCRTP